MSNICIDICNNWEISNTTLVFIKNYIFKRIVGFIVIDLLLVDKLIFKAKIKLQVNNIAKLNWPI